MQRLAVICLCTAVLVSAGCTGLMTTAAVMIKGTDTEPKFDFLLKDAHKVAVVCRSVAPDQYQNETVPREIAREVTDLLDLNIKNKKLSFVDPAKIEKWLDEADNTFTNFDEIGKAKGIDADIVIGIELQDFRIHEPQSHLMFKGQAYLQVRAIDCKTGKVLAKDTLQITDPPNTPIPPGRVTDSVFRAQFVKVVSQQIAILFHPYDVNKMKRIDADSLHMY
jgi:hypothetical protein